MLNSKSFLAVDFGAGSVKIVEFEQNEAGGLRVKQYGYKTLGPEGAQESTRENAILKALQSLLSEKSFQGKKVNVCAPGFHVFSKFVKLPQCDSSKVTQMIQYEAQQNVPFPLDEVVWDYQILGTSATGEFEVLLVAIKAEVVEGLFRVSESAGLQLQLVDVSTAALNNAFRFNYGDMDGCTVLLDIGAKTSNVLFFEKGKVFARSINIGANSITQEFVQESKLPFAEAEKFKNEYGFVSLGGAYEEPDDPHQAQVSKIARQVMTRLHIQINQTLQFYRNQQGGTAPVRLYLSGGGSILPYTAQFFAEKLNVPVEYFNPLRNVEFDPAIDLEELSKVAHALGEVVGLALRNLANCPVELNLMPKSVLGRQQLNQKKPYFIAAVFSLVLVVFAIGFVLDRAVDKREDKMLEINAALEPLTASQDQLKAVQKNLEKLTNDLAQVVSWTQDRFFWGDFLSEFRTALMAAEKEIQKGDTKISIWIDGLEPRFAEPPTNSTPTTATTSNSGTPSGDSVASSSTSSSQKKGIKKGPEITHVRVKVRVYPGSLLDERDKDVLPTVIRHFSKIPMVDGSRSDDMFDQSLSAGTDKAPGFQLILKLKRL